jgi:hypothetical protein
MTENQIGTIIVDSAIEIHTHIGPGMKYGIKRMVNKL